MTADLPCHHDKETIEKMYHHRCHVEGRETAAGVHALVIGVGNYMSRRNPLKRQEFKVLRGTAPAAAHFSRFLCEDFRDPRGIPLRTVRLLLSPAPGQDKNDYLLTGRRPWQEANGEAVTDAMEEWADDCDADENSVGVMYVAAHGVFTPDEAQWAFLSRAGRIDTPYTEALNLTVIQRNMKVRRAHVKVYIWDLCALPGATPSVTGSGRHIGPPDFKSGEKHPGSVSEVVISPRIGTEVWSLTTKEGTVMSQALVGRNTEEYQKRLMYRAADVNNDGNYLVTPAQLGGLFKPIVRELLTTRLGNNEVDVVVNPWGPDFGLNLPTPTPTFQVKLRWQPPISGETLGFRIIRIAADRRVELEDRHDGQEKTVPLLAGLYSVRTSASDISYELRVLSDCQMDLATGKVTS